MFSPTYVSALVIVLVTILNLFKVKVTQADIEPIVSGIVVVIAGIVVMYRRYKQGDLTPIGQIKKV